MRLTLSKSVVRDWATGDLAALVEHANNRNVWINLRDRFPHPYTESQGRDFLHDVCSVDPRTVWAIEVDGAAVGGIGITQLADVERVSAEIGYWLGERFWGRGIMSEAVQAVTVEAFHTLTIERLFALPFADNIGSVRVLEKAGYRLEGRLFRSAIKDGIVRDQLMYAAYRSRPDAAGDIASKR